jgi:glutathione synthase
MKLRAAIQMDPIETVNIAGDSTFAILLEGQARGHELFYYQAKTLAFREGALYATGHKIRVKDEKGSHFALQPEERVDLRDYDTVFMRQDPPFDMNYITVSHLLENIHPKTLVVNDPREVRNAPEKLFVLRYPDLMPPTLITRDPIELAQFRREQGEIILKPLYGNGGAGVFRLHGEDQNFAALVELFTLNFREPFIAQRYLAEVRKGDKRIILIDGEVAGAINRVPALNENRSNMHVGGRPEPSELTNREHEICARLAPDLKERGLIFVGIDVIGDYLTEINVTSPTGIREVKRFGGADIAALYWDAVEKKRG